MFSKKVKQYEKTVYPDGQLNVKMSTNRQHLHIQERIASYEDLFYVKSIADAARYHGTKTVSLFVPCFFGQRSDRRFGKNESFDLKTITDFINSCDFTYVRILDPHSDVTPALIERSIVTSSYDIVRQFVLGNELLRTPYQTNDLLLVSPDAGAYKKVFNYGSKLHLAVVAANKYRDREGNITLNVHGDVKEKTCFIVDDLADGGYTFHVLAKQLKDLGAAKVYLYVSHGYFSKGFDLLKENIDHIFCTNSVRDIQDEFVTQLQII